MRKGLAGLIDRQGPLPHAWQRRQRHMLGAVEDDPVVDLIGEGNDIVLARQSGRRSRQLGAAKDFAGRVVRRVEQHHLASAGLNAAAEFVRIEATSRAGEG